MDAVLRQLASWQPPRPQRVGVDRPAGAAQTRASNRQPGGSCLLWIEEVNIDRLRDHSQPAQEEASGAAWESLLHNYPAGMPRPATRHCPHSRPFSGRCVRAGMLKPAPCKAASSSRCWHVCERAHEREHAGLIMAHRAISAQAASATGDAPGGSLGHGDAAGRKDVAVELRSAPRPRPWPGSAAHAPR